MVELLVIIKKLQGQRKKSLMPITDDGISKPLFAKGKNGVGLKTFGLNMQMEFVKKSQR